MENNINDYKNKMNQLHAPEALIQRTLNKVHEEQAQNNPNPYMNTQYVSSEEMVNINSVNTSNSIYRTDNVIDLNARNTGKNKVGKKYKPYMGIAISVAAALLIIAGTAGLRSKLSNKSEETASPTYDVGETAKSDDYMEESAAEESFDDMALEDVAEESAYENEAEVEYSEDVAMSEEVVEDAAPAENTKNESATTAGVDTDVNSSDAADETPRGSDEGLAAVMYKDLSLADYKSYVGVDLEEIFAEVPVKEETITVKASSESGKVIQDFAELILDTASGGASVKISSTMEVAPKSLTAGTSTSIEDTEVYIGEDKNKGRYFAAFDKAGLHFYLMTTSMNKKEFEELLSKIL